jgi:hypothetical protein
VISHHRVHVPQERHAEDDVADAARAVEGGVGLDEPDAVGDGAVARWVGREVERVDGDWWAVVERDGDVERGRTREVICV